LVTITIFHGLFESRIGSRLAVAAKGDVLHLSQRLGDAGKGGLLEKLTAFGPGQDVPEFVFEDSEVHPAVSPRGGPVHLAVDAVEVANLVGIQVDPDGNTT
jgi:hypothetical protein